jgi:hypothetical protein
MGGSHAVIDVGAAREGAVRGGAAAGRRGGVLGAGWLTLPTGGAVSKRSHE